VARLAQSFAFDLGRLGIGPLHPVGDGPTGVGEPQRPALVDEQLLVRLEQRAAAARTGAGEQVDVLR
jgi:hypothetical protein